LGIDYFPRGMSVNRYFAKEFQLTGVIPNSILFDKESQSDEGRHNENAQNDHANPGYMPLKD
jgi:hypothetical protein